MKFWNCINWSNTLHISINSRFNRPLHIALLSSYYNEFNPDRKISQKIESSCLTSVQWIMCIIHYKSNVSWVDRIIMVNPFILKNYTNSK